MHLAGGLLHFLANLLKVPAKPLGRVAGGEDRARDSQQHKLDQFFHSTVIMAPEPPTRNGSSRGRANRREGHHR